MLAMPPPYIGDVMHILRKSYLLMSNLQLLMATEMSHRRHRHGLNDRKKLAFEKRKHIGSSRYHVERPLPDAAETAHGDLLQTAR